MTAAIEAAPRKMGCGSWGVAFTADCSVPRDERFKTAQENKAQSGLSSAALIEWLDGFSGRKATVTTREGKTWETTLDCLDRFWVEHETGMIGMIWSTR